jgi:hypothetical protein
VPLPDVWDAEWVRDAVTAFASTSDTVAPAFRGLSRFMRPSSPRAVLGRELGAALAGKLPVNLRDQFASAAVFDEGDDPVRWARRTSGLFELIGDPVRVLSALDRQERRQV